MYTCTENYLSGKQQELAIDSGSSKKNVFALWLGWLKQRATLMLFSDF
jgi:hypothetical protein